MVLPHEEASREVFVGSARRVNLVRLAKAQRRLLRLVLAMLCLYVAAIIVRSLLPYRGVLEPAFVLFVVLLSIIGILMIIQTVHLAIASGRNRVLAVFGGLCMLIPLIGLVLVASADGNVSRILRKNGARVGILGVSQSEMLKLTLGYCHGCGYPLAGLTAPRCPECGAPFPV